MLESVLLYAGLVFFGGGVLGLFRKRWRRGGVSVATLGALMMAIAVALPAREQRVATRTSKLDEWMPVWQFAESHDIHIDAPPERVFDAIMNVHANEITLFKTLTTIRRGFRKTPENILNAGDRPLLDVATRSGFIYLTKDAPREVVVGTAVVHRDRRAITTASFTQPLPPGFALATMNFIVIPDARGGSNVSTETRVYANDARSQRAFNLYWKIIHPGSDIIRRMWLRAIKRRAEVR